MALVNARSAVNKDFRFVTETWFTAGDVSPFSELLPGNCEKGRRIGNYFLKRTFLVGL